MTVDVHVGSSVTAGLIGVASSLITIVAFVEYYSSESPWLRGSEDYRRFLEEDQR